MLDLTPPYQKEPFEIEMKPPHPNGRKVRFSPDGFRKIKMENSTDFMICSEEDFHKAKFCKWYVKYKKVPYSEGTIVGRSDKKAGVRGFLLRPVAIVTEAGVKFEDYVGMKNNKSISVFDKRRK